MSRCTLLWLLAKIPRSWKDRKHDLLDYESVSFIIITLFLSAYWLLALADQQRFAFDHQEGLLHCPACGRPDQGGAGLESSSLFPRFAWALEVRSSTGYCNVNISRSHTYCLSYSETCPLWQFRSLEICHVQHCPDGCHSTIAKCCLFCDKALVTW